MKKLIFAALLASALIAQDGLPVAQVDDPAPRAIQFVYVYSGSNLVAVCSSPSIATNGPRAVASVAISGVSKAAAAVITSTGHGLDLNARPKVTISGATGTGWSAINGTFTATVLTVDTFSIPVDSQAFGDLGGTVVFKTTSPRTTQYEWAVQKFAYDGSDNLVWRGWLGGTSKYVNRCSDATSTSTNQQ